MIRTLFCIFCLVSACDDGGSPSTAMDMSMPADLTAGAGTCAAGLVCSMGCTAQNAQTCQFSCEQGVSADAKPYFDAVLTCIINHCTILGGDGGTMDCDDPQSTTCSTCVQAKCGAEISTCLVH
jgi:hypothetical protein